MTVKDIIQKWNSQRIPHLSIDETQELIDEVGRLQEALGQAERVLRGDRKKTYNEGCWPERWTEEEDRHHGNCLNRDAWRIA